MRKDLAGKTALVTGADVASAALQGTGARPARIRRHARQRRSLERAARRCVLQRSMPRFAAFSEEEVSQIQHFIRERARAVK